MVSDVGITGTCAELHMAGNYCDYQHLLGIDSHGALNWPKISNDSAIADKDVIHLQCHVGTDTVGSARRGASRVIGARAAMASPPTRAACRTRRRADVG